VTLALGWRDETVTDLLDIFDYIAERNITAADRLLAMIEHTTEHLPDHSYLHRPGRVSGTREAIVHPNYILVYRVAADVVEILAVLHARQQYP